MGSQKIQGELLGKRPKDWASIQETTDIACYELLLQFLKIKPAETLLDENCESGFFSDLAFKKGADVNGIDVSEQFIEYAKNINPVIKFIAGEMQELPFAEILANVEAKYCKKPRACYGTFKGVWGDKLKQPLAESN